MSRRSEDVERAIRPLLPCISINTWSNAVQSTSCPVAIKTMYASEASSFLSPSLVHVPQNMSVRMYDPASYREGVHR